ncbi:MAG TPA: insulinase family protein, partial [bacterium]|nr:insulinase family protein [bacterium]
ETLDGEEWRLDPPKAATGAQRIAVVKDKAQAFIWLGVPGVGLGHEDFPALGVLNTILGSSSQARLFSRLRGKEGLAYGTYSSILAGQGTGLVLANIGTRPEMYEAAVAGLRREMTELKNAGPTEEEVTDAITYLVGTFAQGHQGHLALANYASANLARNLPWDFEYDLLERQQQVTLEDVRRVAAQYLDVTNHWIAVTGPVYQPPANLE